MAPRKGKIKNISFIDSTSEEIEKFMKLNTENLMKKCKECESFIQNYPEDDLSIYGDGILGNLLCLESAYPILEKSNIIPKTFRDIFTNFMISNKYNFFSTQAQKKNIAPSSLAFVSRVKNFRAVLNQVFTNINTEEFLHQFKDIQTPLNDNIKLKILQATQTQKSSTSLKNTITYATKYRKQLIASISQLRIDTKPVNCNQVFESLRGIQGHLADLYKNLNLSVIGDKTFETIDALLSMIADFKAVLVGSFVAKNVDELCKNAGEPYIDFNTSREIKRALRPNDENVLENKDKGKRGRKRTSSSIKQPKFPSETENKIFSDNDVISIDSSNVITIVDSSSSPTNERIGDSSANPIEVSSPINIDDNIPELNSEIKSIDTVNIETIENQYMVMLLEIYKIFLSLDDDTTEEPILGCAKIAEMFEKNRNQTSEAIISCFTSVYPHINQYLDEINISTPSMELFRKTYEFEIYCIKKNIYDEPNIHSLIDFLKKFNGMQFRYEPLHENIMIAESIVERMKESDLPGIIEILHYFSLVISLASKSNTFIKASRRSELKYLYLQLPSFQKNANPRNYAKMILEVVDPTPENIKIIKKICIDVHKNKISIFRNGAFPFYIRNIIIPDLTRLFKSIKKHCTQPKLQSFVQKVTTSYTDIYEVYDAYSSIIGNEKCESLLEQLWKLHLLYMFLDLIGIINYSNAVYYSYFRTFAISIIGEDVIGSNTCISGPFEYNILKYVQRKINLRKNPDSIRNKYKFLIRESIISTIGQDTFDKLHFIERMNFETFIKEDLPEKSETILAKMDEELKEPQRTPQIEILNSVIHAEKSIATRSYSLKNLIPEYNRMMKKISTYGFIDHYDFPTENDFKRSFFIHHRIMKVNLKNNIMSLINKLIANLSDFTKKTANSYNLIYRILFGGFSMSNVSQFTALYFDLQDSFEAFPYEELREFNDLANFLEMHDYIAKSNNLLKKDMLLRNINLINACNNMVKLFLFINPVVHFESSLITQIRMIGERLTPNSLDIPKSIIRLKKLIPLIDQQIESVNPKELARAENLDYYKFNSTSIFSYLSDFEPSDYECTLSKIILIHSISIVSPLMKAFNRFICGDLSELSIEHICFFPITFMEEQPIEQKFPDVPIPSFHIPYEVLSLTEQNIMANYFVKLQEERSKIAELQKKYVEKKDSLENHQSTIEQLSLKKAELIDRFKELKKTIIELHQKNGEIIPINATVPMSKFQSSMTKEDLNFGIQLLEKKTNILRQSISITNAQVFRLKNEKEKLFSKIININESNANIEIKDKEAIENKEKNKDNSLQQTFFSSSFTNDADLDQQLHEELDSWATCSQSALKQMNDNIQTIKDLEAKAANYKLKIMELENALNSDNIKNEPESVGVEEPAEDSESNQKIEQLKEIERLKAIREKHLTFIKNLKHVRI